MQGRVVRECLDRFLGVLLGGRVVALLAGDVAEKVLEASPVPLTLFRPEMVSEDQAEVDASAFGRRSLPTIPTYRTILVPLDVSVLAEEALSQAIVLASATGATLLLVSVMPLPYHIELPISLRSEDVV